MQLHQVNIAYDPGQDRLLLRMSTSADVEYRLWLTRRVTKGLWPGLMQLVASGEQVRRQAAPEAKQAVMEFQREQALQQANYGTRYEGAAAPATPDGEPILIWSLRMRPLGDGTHELQLMPREGPGVTLRLTEAMLHAFVKLIQDGARATDWGLELELPAAAPVAVPAERKLN